MFSEETLRALSRDVMDVAKSDRAKQEKWKMGFIISHVCDRNPALTKAVAQYMQRQGAKVRRITDLLKKVRRERKMGQLELFAD